MPCGYFLPLSFVCVIRVNCWWNKTSLYKYVFEHFESKNDLLLLLRLYFVFKLFIIMMQQ